MRMSNCVEESNSISNQYSPFLISTLSMNIITKVNNYQIWEEYSPSVRVADIPSSIKSLLELAFLKIDINIIAGRRLTITVSPMIYNACPQDSSKQSRGLKSRKVLEGSISTIASQKVVILSAQVRKTMEA